MNVILAFVLLLWCIADLSSLNIEIGAIWPMFMEIGGGQNFFYPLYHFKFSWNSKWKPNFQNLSNRETSQSNYHLFRSRKHWNDMRLSARLSFPFDCPLEFNLNHNSRQRSLRISTSDETSVISENLNKTTNSACTEGKSVTRFVRFLEFRQQNDEQQVSSQIYIRGDPLFSISENLPWFWFWNPKNRWLTNSLEEFIIHHKHNHSQKSVSDRKTQWKEGESQKRTQIDPRSARHNLSFSIMIGFMKKSSIYPFFAFAAILFRLRALISPS